MPLPFQPWRAALQPASFNGAVFHVEVGGQAGGRRNTIHQFPKQDTPYTEDMGRKARRWPITGYIIGPNYTSDRDDLISACESGGSGTLVHPTLGSVAVNCDTYSVSEARDRGGVCTFEMDFVESGRLPNSGVSTDTQAASSSSASNLGSASSTSLDSSLKTSLDTGPIAT